MYIDIFCSVIINLTFTTVDSTTADLLADARRSILKPLNYSSDINTAGSWIPPLNLM